MIRLDKEPLTCQEIEDSKAIETVRETKGESLINTARGRNKINWPSKVMAFTVVKVKTVFHHVSKEEVDDRI